MDGSIGARTAALMAPYADSDGSGTSYHADDELETFFHAGHMAGLQVGVHAIGDRAIEQVLAVWEQVYVALDSRERRHFRARRHRIEHFEMASTSQIERAAMLGLAVSVQPTFDRHWGQPGGMYESGLGWDRAQPMNPFRTMIDRGIEVGAGSDSPITPFDPLLSIAACETHHDVAQRLSRARSDPVAHRLVGRGSVIRKTRRASWAPGCTRTWRRTTWIPRPRSRSRGSARSSRSRSVARCSLAEDDVPAIVGSFVGAASVCHSLSVALGLTLETRVPYLRRRATAPAEAHGRTQEAE